MFCKNCGTQLPEGVNNCHVCGAPQQAPMVEASQKKPPMALIFGIIAGVLATCLIAIVVVVFLLPLFRDGGDLPEKEDPVSTAAATEATVPPTTEATLPPAPTETVSANPISAGNPYRVLYNDRTFAVLAESSNRYYMRSELLDYTADALCVARNEIFARYGYAFSDADLAEYFEKMPWYSKNASVNSGIYSKFNKYEKANIELLRFCQDRKEGKAGTLGKSSIYMEYYDPNVEYILPTSNRQLVESYHLAGMSKDEMCVARNEIFARHGYTFSDKDLLIYFSYCSWYVPTVESGRTDLLGMSTTERKNVEFIRSVEKGGQGVGNLDKTLNYTVSCKMFSVTLPAYWKSAAAIDYSDDGFRFSEKNSNKEIWGGHVFSFYALSKEDAASFWGGDGWCYGTLTGPQGEQLYVMRGFPTDVQYDYNNQYIREMYQAMYEEESRVAATIKGINGYTFTPA